MTLTADLMAEIAEYRQRVVEIGDRCVRAQRAYLVASSESIASEPVRRAHTDLMRARNALRCALLDLQFARERLARLCDPWFRMSGDYYCVVSLPGGRVVDLLP